VTLYITPGLFRIMHTGSDLSVFDDNDAALASVLSTASVLADSYCNIPLRPQRHSFLGGSITAEQHPWRLAQTPFETTQRRVYPYHTPVRRISQFRIYVTQPDPDIEDGQYVLVAPKDIMTNRVEDYFEVVSAAMTSTGLFNALIVPAIYLAAPLATIDYTYGYDFEVTGEPIYPTDGLTYRSQNNFWHTSTVPVVYVGGVVADPGTYVVDYTEGTILFTSPPTIGATITVDYHHRLPSEFHDAVGLIASYFIERANLVERGLSQVNSIKIAEVEISRMAARAATGDSPKAWLMRELPAAAMMLDDFSQWRAAI
jgi:hypothetical protein